MWFFDHWLDANLALGDVALSALAVETPVLHSYQRKQNVKTLIALASMLGAIRAGARWYFSQTIEILPAERLGALGLPAFMKRKPAKEAVIRNVNMIYGLDLTAKEHDAADAIAVGRAGILKANVEQLWERAVE
jgi:Holliday junction resolvasome RuvABC endonuclease subunit